MTVKLCKCGHYNKEHIMETMDCWGRREGNKPARCPCLVFVEDESIEKFVREMVEDMLEGRWVPD